MIGLLLLGLVVVALAGEPSSTPDTPGTPEGYPLDLPPLPPGSARVSEIGAPQADAPLIVILGDAFARRMMPAFVAEQSTVRIVTIRAVQGLREAVDNVSDLYGRRVVLLGEDLTAALALDVAAHELGAVHTVIAVDPRGGIAAIPEPFFAAAPHAALLVIGKVDDAEIIRNAARGAVVADASPQSIALLAITAAELTA